jgi:hypothetical protein
MRQIRQGVFETNSSSTHSVTIYGSDKYVCPKYIPPIEFGEYGWEQNLYTDYTDKLSYVITMLATKNDINTFEDFLKLKEFRWLKEAIESHCGQVLEVRPQNSDWSSLGHVDHQSDEVLDDFLVPDELEFKVKVLDFVFNEKYAFETDNDNH